MNLPKKNKKKKRRIELIYKQILITHDFLILLFLLVTNKGHYRLQSIINGGWHSKSNGERLSNFKLGWFVEVYFLH